MLVLPNDVGNSVRIENIEIGSQIAISGLRDTQALYASHISPHQKQARDFASGTITALKDDRVTIDKNRSFEVSESTKSTLSLGDFIGINTAKLKERDTSSQTTVRRIYGKMFDGKVTHTAVEGFFAFSGDKKDKNSRFQPQKVSRKVLFRSQKDPDTIHTDGAVDLERKTWRNHRLDKPTDKTRNQPAKRESDQKMPDTKRSSKAKRPSAGNQGRNQNGGGANGGGKSASKP